MFELLVLLLVLQLGIDTFVDSSYWTNDRNENKTPDISIIVLDGIYRITIVAFDNDEDGSIDAVLWTLIMIDS